VYKVNFNQMRTFAEIAFVGMFFTHDSYQMFLAIASAMLAYFFALSWINSKTWRFIAFTALAISICQLSVTVKKAVMDVGFRRMAVENPTGVLVSDVMYGFRAVYATLWRIPEAIYHAWGLDTYSTMESLNYRFLTLIVMLVSFSICILAKPSVAVMTTGSIQGKGVRLTDTAA